MAPPTLYAILRAGRTWDRVRWTGLEVDADGALVLARVPGAAPGTAVDLAGPFETSPSGLAVNDCGDVYLADTAGHRLLHIDARCGERTAIPASAAAGQAPGHFASPRGLLLDTDTLYVADSGNGRVQVFRLPTLEVRAMWTDGLQTPVSLAADSRGWIYVLDDGLGEVLRFSPRGILDGAYRATLSAQSFPEKPVCIALDAEDRLYVSDDATKTVFRFGSDGHALDPLPAPASGGFHPRALSVVGDCLFIADAVSGGIYVFAVQEAYYAGTVAEYRGSVAALAGGKHGDLYIKPGSGAAYYRLDAGAAVVASGWLETERLDAGLTGVWQRISVQATVPEGSRLRLRYYTSNGPAPAADDWTTAASLDTLIVPDDGLHPGRYLWLRLHLISTDRHASPRIEQIRAETTRDSYLRYLPALYERTSGSRAFLRRWLALLRAELGDLEETLTAMPYRIEVATTPDDHLPWLASWLAFRPPPGLAADDLRTLFRRVQDLYRQRGTPAGLIQIVALYTGVRIHLFETFHQRRFWQLGTSASLGFDTGLPPTDPGGLVVPDPAQDTGDAEAWTDPDGLVIGRAVVGHSGPLEIDAFGEPLFTETAHHFCVTVAACDVPEAAQRQALRDVIAREKPAHTDFDLCFVEPQMRVGFQSRVGIDSIVAGPPEWMRLNDAALGLTSTLRTTGDEETTSRIGRRARLGQNMMIQ